MRRRWIADTWSPHTGRPTHAALTGEQAAHLARVLRAQPGQVYDIVANGFLHRAEITAVSDSEVAFTLHEELESLSLIHISWDRIPAKLHLAVGWVYAVSSVCTLIIINGILTFMLTPGAVSYTHLDVYKRQSQS